MARGVSPLAMVLAAALPLASGQSALRAATRDDTAWLQVAVFDESGTPVLDLGPEDFAVRIDGERRPIVGIHTPGSAPLEVLLAFDASRGMRKWAARQAFGDLLDRLPPTTCVGLLVYRERPHPVLWRRADDALLRFVIATAEQDGAAATLDALAAGIRALRDRRGSRREEDPGEMHFAAVLEMAMPGASPATPEHPITACETSDGADLPPRRAVLFYRDSLDRLSSSTIDDVVLAALGGEVSVYALVATDDPSLASISGVSARDLLGHHREQELLSAHAGGLVVRPILGIGDWRDEDRLVESLEHLTDAMIHGYEVGYAAGPRDVWNHLAEVDVTVDRDGVEVLFAPRRAEGRARMMGEELDEALRGFRELERDRPQAALEIFDDLVERSPFLGLAAHGRGLALAMLDREADARSASDRAGLLAPWVARPDEGSASGAVSALPPVRIEIARVAEDGLLARLLAPRLLAAAWRLIERNSLAPGPRAPGTFESPLRMRVERVEQRPSGLEVAGTVRAIVDGEPIERPFRIPDIDARGEPEASLEAAFDALRAISVGRRAATKRAATKRGPPEDSASGGPRPS